MPIVPWVPGTTRVNPGWKTSVNRNTTPKKRPRLIFFNLRNSRLKPGLITVWTEIRWSTHITGSQQDTADMTCCKQSVATEYSSKIRAELNISEAVSYWYWDTRCCCMKRWIISSFLLLLGHESRSASGLNSRSFYPVSTRVPGQAEIYSGPG